MISRKKDSKLELIHRIHRLKGQLDAIERMIDADKDPKDVLVQLQACTSAINGVKNKYSRYIILNSSLGDIREVVDLLT
jgi:DNA-binding FrmR family transcriptional regulator